MEKKRLCLENYYLTKLRIIFIFGFLIDEYLLLRSEDNIILNYTINKFKFFSNWSHMITFIYFITSIVLKKNQKYLKGFTSILFHMAISCQFMVTFVYWTMLHKDLMKTISNYFLIKYCYTVHSLPFIYLLIDFFLNNIVLQPKKTFYSLFVFTTSYLCFLGFLELKYELGIYKDITFKSKLIRYVYILFWAWCLYYSFFRLFFIY